MNVAREAGVHYLAAGHYTTERLGVRSLGEHLAQRYGIGVEFIDIDNPVWRDAPPASKFEAVEHPRIGV